MELAWLANLNFDVNFGIDIPREVFSGSSKDLQIDHAQQLKEPWHIINEAKLCWHDLTILAAIQCRMRRTGRLS